MGFFGHWVVVHGASESALRELGLEPAASDSVPGWQYAFGPHVPDDFEAVLKRAAGAGDGVAIGAWVFDSDYGQVVAVEGDSSSAVAINAYLAEESLAHDPEAVAAWSSHAPHPLPASEVEAIAARGDAFVEETVRELFDRLGILPPDSPNESKDPLLGKLNVTDENPSPVDQLRATALGGFVEPAEILPDIWIAGRRLSFGDARFVLGRGEGFLGIWDRERPSEPIERFRLSDSGKRAARRRVHDLLFEEELSAKETPGLRLYHPGGEPKLIRPEPGVPPAGPPQKVLHGWTKEMYIEVSGKPSLIVEENEDKRWRMGARSTRGRVFLYRIDAYGEDLACLDEFETVEEAKQYAARVEYVEGDWREVPPSVGRTLLTTVRWVQEVLAN